MKSIALVLGLLYFGHVHAQFDKLKAESPGSIKMKKIYAVDTAVFALLGKYSSKQISKAAWKERNSLLMKKYDALHCERLSDSEKELWRDHKQAMADKFLKKE